MVLGFDLVGVSYEWWWAFGWYHGFCFVYVVRRFFLGYFDVLYGRIEHLMYGVMFNDMVK